MFVDHAVHQQRRVQRDERQKNAIDEQVGDVIVLAVAVPLHLQILLAERMGEQLDATVADHGLVWVDRYVLYIFERQDEWLIHANMRTHQKRNTSIIDYKSQTYIDDAQWSRHKCRIFLAQHANVCGRLLIRMKSIFDLLYVGNRCTF